MCDISHYLETDSLLNFCEELRIRLVSDHLLRYSVQLENHITIPNTLMKTRIYENLLAPLLALAFSSLLKPLRPSLCK